MNNRFLIASLLTRYPDQSVVKELCNLSYQELPFEIESILKNYNDATFVEKMASDYIDLFDRSKEANPLYETEYGKSRFMSKGNDLADIAGFYNAFGCKTDGDLTESLDHIAVELEFYWNLSQKADYHAKANNSEAISIIESAMKKFLSEHLGRLAYSIAGRPMVMESTIYGNIYRWIKAIVSNECERLNISVETYGLAESVSDDLSCGMSCGAGNAPTISNS